VKRDDGDTISIVGSRRAVGRVGGLQRMMEGGKGRRKTLGHALTSTRD
jgi:hypothetical protein